MRNTRHLEIHRAEKGKHELASWNTSESPCLRAPCWFPHYPQGCAYQRPLWNPAGWLSSLHLPSKGNYYSVPRSHFLVCVTLLPQPYLWGFSSNFKKSNFLYSPMALWLPFSGRSPSMTPPQRLSLAKSYYKTSDIRNALGYRQLQTLSLPNSSIK